MVLAIGICPCRRPDRLATSPVGPTARRVSATRTVVCPLGCQNGQSAEIWPFFSLRAASIPPFAIQFLAVPGPEVVRAPDLMGPARVRMDALAGRGLFAGRVFRPGLYQEKDACTLR